jgi:hypothetical protein
MNGGPPLRDRIVAKLAQRGHGYLLEIAPMMEIEDSATLFAQVEELAGSLLAHANTDLGARRQAWTEAARIIHPDAVPGPAFHQPSKDPVVIDELLLAELLALGYQAADTASYLPETEAARLFQLCSRLMLAVSVVLLMFGSKAGSDPG